jgi:predicted metal-dependent hydrolase
MSFLEKHAAVSVAKAAMESSKVLCLSDAMALFGKGNMEYAEARLEKAAQYAWGFWRPAGWSAAESVAKPAASGGAS